MSEGVPPVNESRRRSDGWAGVGGRAGYSCQVGCLGPQRGLSNPLEVRWRAVGSGRFSQKMALVIGSPKGYALRVHEHAGVVCKEASAGVRGEDLTVAAREEEEAALSGGDGVAGRMRERRDECGRGVSLSRFNGRVFTPSLGTLEDVFQLALLAARSPQRVALLAAPRGPPRLLHTS